MKRFVALVLALLLMVSFAACGTKDAGLDGKYILVRAESGGVTLEGDMLATVGLGDAYVEFTSDGGCTLFMLGETTTATYVLNGSSVEIDDGSVFTLEGNAVTLNEDGVIAVFEKA